METIGVRNIQVNGIGTPSLLVVRVSKSSAGFIYLITKEQTIELSFQNLQSDLKTHYAVVFLPETAPEPTFKDLWDIMDRLHESTGWGELPAPYVGKLPLLQKVYTSRLLGIILSQLPDQITESDFLQMSEELGAIPKKTATSTATDQQIEPQCVFQAAAGVETTLKLENPLSWKGIYSPWINTHQACLVLYPTLSQLGNPPFLMSTSVDQLLNLNPQFYAARLIGAPSQLTSFEMLNFPCSFSTLLETVLQSTPSKNLRILIDLFHPCYSTSADLTAPLPGQPPDFDSPRIAQFRRKFPAYFSSSQNQKVILARPSELPNKISEQLPISKADANPTFTILIPYYRHFDFFRHCGKSLEAVCKGEALNTLEIIILNDDPSCSEKDLMDCLPILARRFARVISYPERFGITRSLNRGISEAKNDWIIFLDCDDLIEPHVLKTIREYILRYPSCRYMSSNMIDIDSNGEVLRYRPRRASPIQLLTHGMIMGHLKIVRKDAFDDFGALDSNFDGCQDFEFVFRMAVHEPLLTIPEYLYRYRWHRNTQSVSQEDRQALTTARVFALYAMITLIKNGNFKNEPLLCVSFSGQHASKWAEAIKIISVDSHSRTAYHINCGNLEPTAIHMEWMVLHLAKAMLGWNQSETLGLIK